MELEDQLKNLGIELITIDVTQYILDTLYKANIKGPERFGSFIIELEDSTNPAVSENLINYYITGTATKNLINNLEVTFYHDLQYNKNTELTKCVFLIKEIENKILEML